MKERKKRFSTSIASQTSNFKEPKYIYNNEYINILKKIKDENPNSKFIIFTSAISSDLLSSGEKQLLSFLAYNAFMQNAIFIIDEPELSLHVDWQRQLFPTLLKQGTSNQFIVATHSPFIYSKYPDKELMLSSDKGNNED